MENFDYTFKSIAKAGYYREDIYISKFAPDSSELLSCLLYMDSFWSPAYRFQAATRYYGIDLVIDGELEIKYGNTCRYLKKGMICLINPDEIFTKRAMPPQVVHRRTILLPANGFNRDIMESCFFKGKYPILICDAPPETAALLDSLKEILSSNTHDLGIRISILLFEILQRIRTRLEPEKPHALVSAVHYLEINSNRVVSVCELAARSGVSGRTLSRLFHAHYGMTPTQYGVRLRLERAKLLLSTGYAEIKEVAAECGFCNPGFFTRSFKKIYGENPSHFLKNAHNVSYAAAETRRI